MLKIDWIQEKVRKSEYYFSKHGDHERQNDDLTIGEIEEALLTGRILEQYEDPHRGQSCLVAGFTETGKPIHIVCGARGDCMVIITLYIPLPPKFITPFKRG